MDYAYNYESMDIGGGTVDGLMMFGSMMLIVWVIGMALTVLQMIAMWKIYVKAGRPGWGAIVPVYNSYLMFDLALGNGWLFLTMFLPFVNLYFGIKCYVALAKKFGYPWTFALGLLFLGPVFFLILAFGDCTYEGNHKTTAPPPLSPEEREAQRQAALEKMRRQHIN